jgi:hypothetical protein
MGGSAGKRKGKSYEDKIASMLHEIFFETCPQYKELFEAIGNDDLKPQRDSSSGVFLRADGDIELNLLKKHFPFTVECKFRKGFDFSINTLFKNNKTLIDIWKKQVIPKMKEKNLKGIIVFRGNRTLDFCMIEKNIISLNNIKRKLILDNFIVLEFTKFLEQYILELIIKKK